MAMPSFAFSVHNFISSVGADAGFAAAIGLAVLILLYFAHARETANLREQAALLTQRLQQAEARVAQLMQPALTPQPAGAPAELAARAPFAPLGTAAPALASATRVIPMATPAQRPAAATPAPAPAVAPGTAAPPTTAPAPATAPALAMAKAGAAAAPPAAAAASPPAAAPPPPPQAGPPPTAPGVTAPATPAGVPAPATAAGANAPAAAAGGNGAGSPPTVSRPEWSQRAAGRPSGVAPSRSLPPPLAISRARPRRRIGRGVAVALAALVAVAVAVGLFAVTSIGGSPKRSGTSSSTNSPGSSRSGAAVFKPSSVTVAVLNGTAVNQLAHRIADRLAARGYKEGTIATAANQTEATTVVAYRSGSTDRKDAARVAGALGLRGSAVRPVDQSTLQVACPALSTCTANVVVTVGSDLAAR